MKAIRLCACIDRYAGNRTALTRRAARTIKNYCRAMGYELVDIVMDAESGKNMTGRPEFQRMISQYVDKRKSEFHCLHKLGSLHPFTKDFPVL